MRRLVLVLAIIIPALAAQTKGQATISVDDASLPQVVPQQPASQQFNFPTAEIKDPGTRPNAMFKFATDIMAAYTEADRIKYLDNLFRLQIVAGRYADAVKTITSLSALQISKASPQTGANNVQYEIVARARGQTDRGRIVI